jgi:hypothetical protein
MKVALVALLVLAQDEKPLKYEAPKEWTKETPTSKMRKAQFKVPDKEKKAKDAELTLFYFGPNAGGVDANLKRWAGQMGQKEYKSEAIQGKCKVTLVDLSGTYTDGFTQTTIENARMLGAVVETEEGPWFFKLVGPGDTVGDWREELIKLLKEAQL